MKWLSSAALLLFPAAIWAAVNGPCSGIYNNGICICIDHNTCRNRYGGTAIQGSSGAWPCPYDADNIWGCEVWSNCPGRDSSTGCAFDSSCRAWGGRILSDPICPGRNNFVCCDF